MIVLTGGAGFIGSVVLSKLNLEGIDDVVVVDSIAATTKWKNLVGKRFKEYVHKDDFLTRLEQKQFSKIDSIIHMGACSSTAEMDLDYLMRNNYEYTIRLAQYAVSKGIRFIYASSGATYGGEETNFSDQESQLESLRPLNPYGFSKHTADLWMKQHNLLNKVCGIKFFNVYGPNEYHKEDMRSVVHKAYEQIVESGTLKLFKSYRPEFKDGEQKRDFVYVKDCAEVVWWFYKNRQSGANGIFNLGSGVAASWLELAKAVFAAVGKEPKIDFIEMPAQLRKQYQYYTRADITKLRAAGCDIQFRSLRDGVLDYVLAYLGKGAYL